MTYTWLLFDADDTLFDYPIAEGNALRATFDHFGQIYRSEYLRLYQIFNRQVWAEFERGQTTSQELRLKRFKLLFSEIQVPLDPQDFSLRYLENLSLTTDLIPGALEVLRSLSGRFHIALVTNGLSEVQHPRLDRSTIRPFIEKDFISEEVGTAKPAAGFFDFVFKEIGQPEKSQVLIIGDSPTSDMQGGINYGIDTCWFNPGRNIKTLPVTYEIHALKELLEILK